MRRASTSRPWSSVPSQLYSRSPQFLSSLRSTTALHCASLSSQVGGDVEIAAKGGLRIEEDDREIGLAVVAQVERLVVGDEFGEQRDHEQDQEDPQRPIAAPVGFEILPAADVDRRKLEQPRRADDTERSGRLGVGRVFWSERG